MGVFRLKSEDNCLKCGWCTSSFKRCFPCILRVGNFCPIVPLGAMISNFSPDLVLQNAVYIDRKITNYFKTLTKPFFRIIEMKTLIPPI